MMNESAEMIGIQQIHWLVWPTKCDVTNNLLICSKASNVLMVLWNSLLDGIDLHPELKVCRWADVLLQLLFEHVQAFSVADKTDLAHYGRSETL